MRNVLLTEFFGRSDWGKLDKHRDNDRLSRFDTWPLNVFEKEVKKTSDSDSSEQMPRKRDTKAAKKDTALPPATNSVSLDSDSIIELLKTMLKRRLDERKRKKIEESPSVAIEVPQLTTLSFNLQIESTSKSGDDLVEWTDEKETAYQRDLHKSIEQGLTSVGTHG